MIGLFGDLGSFKTATLTLLMRDYVAQDLPVVANYNVDYPNCKKLEIGELLSMTVESGGKGLMGLDEIYALAESRVSSSKANRFISYFGFQSRKLGWDVGYTAQLASSVDLRFYNLTDIKIACYGLQDNGSVKLVVQSGSKTFNRYIPLWVYEELVWGHYDTKEVISPLGVKDLLVDINAFNTPKLNMMVDEAVVVVRKALGSFNPYKLTHGDVEDVMLLIGEPLGLSKMVFNRIRRGNKIEVSGVD